MDSSSHISDTLYRTQESFMSFVPSVINSLAANPWVMLLALFLLGIFVTIRSLLAHPVVIEALAKRINNPEILEVIKQIRADQLVSNAERAKQTERLDEIEKDIEDLKSQRCLNGSCPNREHAG